MVPFFLVGFGSNYLISSCSLCGHLPLFFFMLSCFRQYPRIAAQMNSPHIHILRFHPLLIISLGFLLYNSWHVPIAFCLEHTFIIITKPCNALANVDFAICLVFEPAELSYLHATSMWSKTWTWTDRSQTWMFEPPFWCEEKIYMYASSNHEPSNIPYNKVSSSRVPLSSQPHTAVRSIPGGYFKTDFSAILSSQFIYSWNHSVSF